MANDIISNISIKHTLSGIVSKYIEFMKYKG